MKNINLTLIFAISVFLSLFLGSCGEDQDMTISDKQKDNVPEEVQLLEYSDNSVTLAWDFVKNATSYTVQILEDPQSEYPLQYYTTSTEDYYQFTKLNKNASYYLRVRANYPYSATSDWVYLMNGDKKARFVPRYGIVSEDFEIPMVKLVNSSTSTLTLTWSVSLFDNLAEEYKNNFTLGLYEDKACTNLVVSWDVAGSEFFTESTVRFTFSGLDPGKSYFFKAKDLTLDKETLIYEFKTKSALPIVVATPTQKGDIILSQDFGNFIHGGDILFEAAGYTVAAASGSITGEGRKVWSKATGENPVDAAMGRAICAKTAGEFNVFDGGSITTAYTAAAGVGGWGKSGNTSTRPGYMKLGGGSGGLATLYSPELKSLTSESTITVRFKAAIYIENGTQYCEDIVVRSVKKAVFSDKGAISNEASIEVSNETIVPITDAVGDFKEYKVVLKGVSPDSRISFGSNPNKASANKTRFLLDDIVIELGEN